MQVKTSTLHIPLIYKLSTRSLFFILSAVLLSIFILYGFLVNKTVMNIVARQKTEQTISSLSGSIGDLEFKYMALKSDVTLDLAYSKGFEEAQGTTFISRDAALSYNTAR